MAAGGERLVSGTESSLRECSMRCPCRPGMPTIILLPDGTSIVLPVGYMNQPTGLLHIYR